MITKKNIVTCIILSFITCGIYNIIWFINLTEDIAFLSEDNNLIGAKAFIFTLLTCGIYAFFWAYNIGKGIQKAQQKRNLSAEDNSTIFVILQLIPIGNIITLCIAQDEINKMADN